jgi:hypothetical protein
MKEVLYILDRNGLFRKLNEATIVFHLDF